MEKIFIIGFGAQKGGTTWLAENLKQAGVRFPWGKEARILSSNNLNKDQHNTRIDKTLDQTKKSLSNINSQNKKDITKIIADPKKAQRLIPTIKKSEKNYRSKLNSIWRRASKSYALMGEESYAQQVDIYMKQKNISHAGDITPIYCRLKKDQMNDVYDYLKRLNISPRAIFIARDPIDRIWSKAKMMAKRNRDKFKTSEDTLNFFKKCFSNGGIQTRTRYEITLKNLKNSSFSENLLVLFYEDLFTEKTWDDVLNFIDLEAEYKCDFSRINPSPEIRMHLSEEIRKEVINYYSETYIYMKKEYPQVERLWENSYRLLN